MIKKTITYIDYDGMPRTEDFYFNLNKVELTEMEVSCKGGLSKTIEKVMAEKDQKELINIFKELILKAYGEKTLDGKYFTKNQALRDAFECTEAFVDIFTEVSTDSEAAAAFVNGIVPKMDPSVIPSVN